MSNYHEREAAYRASAGLNQSALKPLKVSPQHARYRADVPVKQTDAMALGTLFERLVACPDDLRAEVKADYAKERARYTEQKARAEADGVLLVAADAWAKAEAMRDAVWRSADASALLTGADYCQPLHWTYDGQARKGLLDARKVVNGKHLVIDLKTTSATMTPDELAKQVETYGYHLQAAWYLQGYREVYGVDAEFWFVFVESAAPHAVVCVQLDDDWLAAGAAEVEALAAVWRDCEEAGVWPGPAEMAVNGEPRFPAKLSRPKWARGYQLEV